MDTEVQFRAILSKLDGLQEPADGASLGEYSALVTEAVQLCEKLLLYLATSPARSEDMLSYLFEYKQLLNLEKHLAGLKHSSIPVDHTPPPKLPWWRKWK